MEVEVRQEHPPQVPEEFVLWNIDAVKEVIDYKSTSAVWNLINKHNFPRPVKIGARRSLWNKSKVLEWIGSRKEEDA